MSYLSRTYEAPLAPDSEQGSNDTPDIPPVTALRAITIQKKRACFRRSRPV
jgi:hypothetical protein